MEMEEPEAKRQKRRDASDIVAVNVGGTKFVTAIVTLTASSDYFASLLAGDWAESYASGDKELFLDHDPVPFAVLMVYMRSGTIKIEDITPDVLFLAQFLAMEKLLAAVKTRWYINIGKHQVPAPDCDDFEQVTASLFDKEYVDVSNAIKSGLFPFIRKPNNDDCERDFAVISMNTLNCTVDHVSEYIAGAEWQIESRNILGALNGLYSKGYELSEVSRDWIDNCENYRGAPFHHPERHIQNRKFITLFRRRHYVIPATSEVWNTLILPDDEAKQRHLSKQFAFAIADHMQGPRIVAPISFGDGDPFAIQIISFGSAQHHWLEKHNFVKREAWLEGHHGIKDYIEILVKSSVDDQIDENDPGSAICRIYSRMVETKKLRSEE
ncbi:hypothetical protein ACHAWF_004957 [Thalassiosira exigua]